MRAMTLVVDDALVVVDAVKCRRERIAEAMILDQLMTEFLELLEIRTGRFRDRRKLVVELDIAVETQSPKVPVRVIEHGEPEKII